VKIIVKTKQNLSNVELGGTHRYQFLYQYVGKTNSHISYMFLSLSPTYMKRNLKRGEK